jgi:hypothetical protein
VETRWVDVEIEVVVRTAVRTGFEATRTPERCQLLVGCSHAPLGQQRAEALRDARYAELGRDDVPGELSRVGDDEVRPPLERHRRQVGQHRRRQNRAEQLAEHDVRHLERREIVELRVEAPYLGHLRQPGLTRGRGADARLLDVGNPVVRDRPQHFVSTGGHRTRQRHHRMDVTQRGRRREENPAHTAESAIHPTTPSPRRFRVGRDMD